MKKGVFNLLFCVYAINLHSLCKLLILVNQKKTMISTLINRLGIKDAETVKTTRIIIELILFCISFLLFLISLCYIVLNF